MAKETKCQGRCGRDGVPQFGMILCGRCAAKDRIEGPCDGGCGRNGTLKFTGAFMCDECTKTGVGLAAAEVWIASLYADCFFCGGCGNAHGYCERSDKERAKRDIGRHHVFV